ncbi:uncharacterized protein LOC111089483, partial [Limulus polyphemus]|uniref:Uncharacterized protein LOC111089483 n=1 Tax=Limulus polyphemus TaxID=6850 RepID=A0ABM1TPJ0_LIMPO
IQDADGCFFENFTALSWKQENRKLQAEREDEAEKDQPLPIEADVGITPLEFKIAKKEFEQLYVEVLYTIKHKLGASSGNYDAYAGDLYDYAQEAFGMSSDNHRRLLAVAQEEKPPIPVLNVVVVEAIDLEAKDSDVCILWRLPSSCLEAVGIWRLLSPCLEAFRVWRIPPSYLEAVGIWKLPPPYLEAAGVWRLPLP